MPAHLLASFAGARVVEPFETKGGAGGERMRRIIEMHERVLAALEAGGTQSLPAAKELREYGAVLFETLFPGTVRRRCRSLLSLRVPVLSVTPSFCRYL